MGLVTGTTVHTITRADGTVARWRDIVALEITDSNQLVRNAEPMHGIDDLERAAGALL